MLRPGEWQSRGCRPWPDVAGALALWLPAKSTAAAVARAIEKSCQEGKLSHRAAQHRLRLAARLLEGLRIFLFAPDRLPLPGSSE